MNVQASPLNCGKQSASHKLSSKSSRNDLWLIAQQGSIAELESALILLKKNGGNIDSRNIFGLTPLHIATWRNSVPIVKRLLEAGSDPDARDGESGWSSLHRALHFGHLAVASVLLQFGASLSLEDSKYRTPVDLLSGPVLQAVGDDTESVAVEVYSWGNGTNYQLGTGNSHIAKLPCKVDTLHDSYIKLIAASKFHSVAVGSQGELYTWGFGRGGRLGHPDFDIHSGQAAITTPRRVTVGLGSKHVKIVAAAKHHTVIATENGEVFTWGSNREGQLGYTSVDTQPTPRRVSSLKSRVIAVAAANKHSAAVTECGEIFTWGCNKEGQLGYGTSNSASNYIPRMVEYLKGKVIRGVSAAKYHTVVLVADSEVYTWGHRLVTPKRVVVARCLKKSGNALMKFHRTQRLHLVSVVAGTSHSTAMSEDGTLFYWVSSDPDLRCQQVYSLCGKNIVSISTGKYWTSAVTITGDVYMWDGKNCKNITPIITRVHGVKHVTSVAVGETHMLMLCSLYHPMLLPSSVLSSKKPIIKDNSESEELDDEIQFDDLHEDRISLTKQDSFNSNVRSSPSLKSLCEKTAAEFIVEPKNALQLLEIADSLEADELRKHCENVVLRNLDYLFTVAVPAITSASLEILAKLEKLLDEKSSDAWCYHRLPTHTATFPAVIYSDEECDDNISGITPRYHKSSTLKKSMDQLKDLFSQGDIGADEAVLKQVRAVRKKLQQIEMLESKQANGHTLDDQQIAKLQTRTSLEFALSELGFPVEKDDRKSSPLNEFSDLRGSKKSQVSKKEKRKNRIKEAPQSEALAVGCELSTKMDTGKGFGDGVIVQSSEEKKDVKAKLKDENKNTDHLFPLSPCTPKANSNMQKGKASGQKKKIKKGGLSMFLSGALDDAPKPVPPPPPTPKNEGPAWGGVKIAKGPASLLDIQNEQKKVTDVASSFKPKGQSETSVERVSCGPVKSAPLVSGPVKSNPLVGGPHSSSIAVGPTRATSSLGEKNTPPWSTSPVQQRPSLRDIQMQQEKKQSLSHSPKTKTSGFSIATNHASPSESLSSTPNRWYKPEIDAPSSIRCIQIEEKAIKDLKRFYPNVKIVKAKP